ncbi:MAG TPA: hypothetical protein VNH46_08275, partial [Gemmatimonadales bacterium]|nr:hypothetical protein [Gemmatimonadales bacterium]
LLSTCESDTSGPSGGPGYGTLVVAPEWPANGQFVGANLFVDHVHAFAVRPSDPTHRIKDVRVAFDPDKGSLRLPLELPLRSTAESLDVTLELEGSGQVLFGGGRRLEVRTGPPPSTPAPTIPLTYQGPGTQLAALILAPLDSFLNLDGQLPMRVSGLDAQQQPVPAFYVSWSSGDSTIARVNADGVVTARVPRGTVYIRARTPATSQLPQGVAESTTVTIAPSPATAAIVSGNNQTGVAGQPLAQPFVLQVKANDNLGVPRVTVTFTPPAGGSVTPAVTSTDANGMAQATGTLPSGATGPVSFSAVAGNLAALTFTATAAAPAGPTWTGAVSTDWNTAGNWSTGQVPTAADDVIVPVTSNQPLIGQAAQVHNLTVQAGAVVTLGVGIVATVNGNLSLAGTFAGASGNLAVVGNLTTLAGSSLSASVLQVGGALAVAGSFAVSNNVLFNGAGQTIPGGLPYVNLTVTGTAALGGRTAASNTVEVFGNGSLTLAGHTLVAGLVQVGQSTGETATITMTNPLDSIVTTNFTAGGGSTAGKLTAGTIVVSGNFNQIALNSPQAFAPSGSHTVAFTGSGTQTVNFNTPGAGQSGFQNLQIINPAGGLTLTSDVLVSGQAAYDPGVPDIVHGNGHTVTLRQVNVNSATFDNTLVVLSNMTFTRFDNVTFQNYAPTATVLTVDDPGAASHYVFNNLVFGVTPTTGFYLRANDNTATGSVLTINMVNPTPATPGGFVQTAGGAVVNW